MAAASSGRNGLRDGMSEKADNDAWRVPPGAYLAKRPTEYRVGQPTSQYVEMRDGCRLAVDAYVPQSPDGASPAQAFPTLVFFTPYYRRFKLRPGGTGEVNPNTGKFRDFFVPRGYAVVVVDARGTGASFGIRDSFRSPRERNDSSEIADSIVAQDWSDGTIRRDRHFLCRRRGRLPGLHRSSRGEGNRATFVGLGHLCRQLFSRRHSVEIADQGL